MEEMNTYFLFRVKSNYRKRNFCNQSFEIRLLDVSIGINALSKGEKGKMKPLEKP